MFGRGSFTWLHAATLVAALLPALTILLGWNRSYWFDEVYTLGVSTGPTLDWAAILTDVHPPTHPLLVRWTGELLGLSPDSFLHRLVNLPGLVALAAAIRLVARLLPGPRGLLFAVLTLVNGYTLSQLVELRTYFLLLGLAALGHALLLAESKRGPRTGPLVATAAALTALHFFGAAVAGALLASSAAGHWADRRRGRALLTLAAAGILSAATLAYAFGVASLEARLGGNLWITNGPGPFLDFVSLQLPAAAVALALLLARRLPRPEAAGRPLAQALAVPALVVLVAALISVHSPVISARNLIVCAPGVLLALALALPERALQRIALSPLVLLIVLAAGARYVDGAVRNAQMIAWAVRTATPPECDGIPVHVLKPGPVDTYAQEVFLGALRRPLRDLSEFDPATFPESCPYPVMAWHEDGPVSAVAQYLDSRGIDAEILLPPDPRLAKDGRMTHGFVVRIRPEP